MYASASPITYVEWMQAPVLIIQGRNDTHTPARPIHEYEQRMHAAGKSIEVIWFDAGHLGTFAQTDLAIAHQKRMLAFAQRIFAG